ncbi:MAG: S41 family peptidase [Spirochaetales bacterium]
MENKKYKPFSHWFLLVLFTVAFALIILLVPQVHAYSPTRESNAENDEKYRYLDVINSVYNYLLNNYVDEIDPRILYEGALEGMLNAVEDPYTTYMDAVQVRSLTDTTDGNFGGVGLSITKSAESTPEKPAYVEVVSPIEGTPGWKAGIQTGDLILTIDEVATPDITMDEVLDILRGAEGSSVDLTLRRGNTDFSVTLIRDIIEVPTVKYGMITENGQNTGYMRIIQFTPQTPERVQEALDSFISENFDSLIIDLRNNPGGLIDSVADVADKFIDSGVIVSTKSRLMFENTVFRASKKNTTMPSDIPIAVLINRGAASASEILAGALKDYHLAYLVGERTFGKGSVQQVQGLPYNDGFKITMARYYTPSDSNIDKIGIPPDTEVLYAELSEEESDLYIEIITSDVISDYVHENPGMNEAAIAAYARELAATYNLEESLLRRLIRMEVFPDALYDLDFDVQLIKALEIVHDPNFYESVKNAKTLSELQVIAAEEDESLKSN